MSDTTNTQPESAIIVSVRRGKPGLTRKVSTAHIEIGGVSYSVADLETKRQELGAERLQALIDGTETSDDPFVVAAAKRTDKSFVRASKYILSHDALKGVERVDGKIRDLLETYCFRSDYLREGTYFVPNRVALDLDNRLNSLKAEREEEVEAFLGIYPQMIADMPRKLGILFDPTEYDSAEELRKKFTVSIQYTTMDAPGSLAAISTEIFERERARAQEQYRALLAEVEQQLLEGAEMWLNFLIEKLTDHTDGAPKVIRSSSMEQVRDFFNLLANRNETNHAALNALGEKGKKIVSGMDVSELKINQFKREALRDKIVTLKAGLEPHIGAAPRRRMQLPDSIEDAA